ncbi:MAG: PEP/pyruvate-binding domain-containing protein [Thermodesulfobacteriota bacterium]
MTADKEGPFWLPLSPDTPPDISLLGGKGANLVRLMRAGFDVPAGAVLPTTLLNDLDWIEIPEVKRFIERAIKPHDRPDLLWAVRSSAADEDGAEASFAGQHDTFLNVPAAGIFECVTKCRESVYSTRAESYRADLGRDGKPSLAVILQKMVPARCAGVLFTRHPVRPDQDRIVVEGVPGLGEDLVAGRRAPDRLELSRGGKIMSERTANPVNCLNQVGQEAFARLARELERFFGSPQDAEWAFDGETLWLLQTRPITTIRRPAKVWTRAWGDEFWAEATTDLQYTFLGRWIREDYMADLARINGWNFLRDVTPFARIHSHVYFNSEYMYRLLTLVPPPLRIERMLGWIPPYWRPELPDLKFRPLVLMASAVRSRLADRHASILSHYKKLPGYTRRVRKKLKPRLSDDLTRLDDRALWKRLKAGDRMGRAHFRFIRWGLASYLMATKLACAWITEKWTSFDAFSDPEGHFLEMLLIDPAGNTTRRVNEEMKALGREAAQVPALMALAAGRPATPTLDEIQALPGAGDFAARLEKFIAEHGHRGSSRELHLPRWMDDPSLVIGPVLALAASGKAADEKPHHNDFEARWLDEIGQNPGGWWKRAAARRLLKLARAYTQYRENQRYALDYILTDMRHVLLEVANRLVKRSVLRQPDDIFFLTYDELGKTWTGKAAAPDGLDRRRARFEADSKTLPPEWIMDDKPCPPPEEPLHPPAGILSGTGASPGLARGPARIVRSVDELRTVRAGDILVAPNTDPGWTPVFGLIAGLVVQTGGMLSHAAIVAREYGIPAVTGVANACALMAPDEMIEVNGDAGRIQRQQDFK